MQRVEPKEINMSEITPGAFQTKMFNDNCQQ